jgi:putative transposase
MSNDSRAGVAGETPRVDGDTIELRMRERIRATIEEIVEEELAAELGAGRSSRVEERRGYRHGTRERTLTTTLGPATFEMPRARVVAADGARKEWRSETIRRYERRTARLDEAILGVYLCGANTRRIRGALAPLLRGGPLSKDAVSRLVGRLAQDFAAWSERDLAGEAVRYLIQDGWYPKVRIGKRRVVVPVLVTLGVREDGERIILDMRMAGEESGASWSEVLASLVRKMSTPVLAIIDGNPGLHAALQQQWPSIAIQRCTAHKLRNLTAKAPARLREELKEDYRRMIYGEDEATVERARTTFSRKWKLRCPPVMASFDEAGDELFTFTRFPKSQWKALRTTNALERISGEFRRRTTTQSSLPSSDAVMLLLFGLLRSGAVRLRRMDGWEDMPRAAARKIA